MENATPQSNPLVGTLFQERFLIESSIGTGGAGAVYKCFDQLLNRPVALKLLHQENLDSDEKLDRFQREAQLLNQLSHPNVMSVFSFGVTPDWQPYLVLPYVEGSSLAKCIEDHRLDLKLAISILLNTCDALIHLHDHGIIHRDLKPGNIMITTNENGTVTAQLVDFGIAKCTSTTKADIQKLTATGEIFGSPSYMSPEQWRGGQIDYRTDIYSFGILMYEIFSAKLPWTVENLVAVMLDKADLKAAPLYNHALDKKPVNLSTEMKGVVFKAMDLDISKRFQTMIELKEKLLETPECLRTGNSDTMAINRVKSSSTTIEHANSQNNGSSFVAGIRPTSRVLTLIALIFILAASILAWYTKNTLDGNLFWFKTRLFLNSPPAVSQQIELANELYSNNRKSDAVALYTCLDKSSVLEQIDSRSAALIMNRLAESGDSNKSRLYARRALDLFDQLSHKAERENKFCPAIEYAKLALQNRQRESPRNSTLEGLAHFHLSQLYEKERAQEKTEAPHSVTLEKQSYTEALKLLERDLKANLPYVIMTEYNLALLCASQKQLDEELEHLEKALKLAKEAYSVKHPTVSMILKSIEELAHNYQIKGDTSKSGYAFGLARSER